MAYDVVDFSDLVAAVVAELKLDPNDTNEIVRIKRDINLVYRDEVVPKRRWKWLMGHVAIRHEAYIADGTVSMTPASATITFSVPPLASVAGYQFAVDNYSEIYKIESHTAGSATATLATAYTGALNAAATYKIWTDEVALPTNLRETFEVWHDFSTDPMRPVGLQDFRRQSKSDPRFQARPLYYTTYDYADPSPGDGEHESDRYRLMLVYPSLSEKTTTLKIDYVKEIGSLDADGDEPVLPIEDRIVLVYGALERAWRRARNPEEAANNRALFERKLALMEGRVEDTFDTPQLAPRSEYMAKKRSRGIRAKGASVSNGGTYQIPTYLANTTINGANLVGNVTAAAGVTVDGRDLSVDGLSLDAHVAATSAVHGVTGSVVGTSGAQILTNKSIDATQNVITEISDVNIAVGANIAKTKLASGSANRVEVTNGTGQLTESIIITDELEYLDDVEKLTAVTLADNTSSATMLAQWAVAAFDTVTLSYSVSRGTANKEAGVVTLVSDGTSAAIAQGSIASLGTVGVVLTADIDSGNLRLLYTTTSTGVNSTFKYKLSKWLA